jgi:hypothetical protein
MSLGTNVFGGASPVRKPRPNGQYGTMPMSRRRPGSFGNALSFSTMGVSGSLVARAKSAS